MGWKLFLLIKPASICLWTLLVRYFSEKNIQRLFSQRISMQDKSSPSYPQHSLGFSVLSGREYYSHQKEQPLLARVFLGIFEQYLLHPFLFSPVLPPILCVTSSELSNAWAALLLGLNVVQPGSAGTCPAPGHGPAQASGHSPGSQAQPLAPHQIALLPGWLQANYFLPSSRRTPPPVTNECLCTTQGETPFTVS